MHSAPTNVEKMRRLPWGIAGGAANSVYCQLSFFGSAFILFLSELGLNKTQIGSLMSLFPFTGLIALFIAPAVARWGYKRIFLTFWGARKATTGFLLLTPLVLSSVGSEAALLLIAGTVALFALCRAIGETAALPWEQEYIPSAVRGKYSATSNIFSNLASFAAVLAAGSVLGSAPDMNRFMLLFGVAMFFGVVCVWAYSFLPGGAPKRGVGAARTSHRDLVEPARDRGFLRYLVAIGLITLFSGPLASFLPLFMQEQVGLSSSNVVRLGTGTLLGGLLSSYLWGWAADRYGSKPVMLSGLSLKLLLPICWLLMPRHSAWSLYAALAIAVLQGLATLGWAIGSGRLLYVSVVPPEKKTEYMALYYAWIGIIGGLGQLFGGRVLDLSAGISGQFWIVTLDPYTVLFLAAFVLPLTSGLFLLGVPADSRVSTGEFARMFLQGNPFMALESLIRYHRAKDERASVAMTERLGRTRSPLTVDELLEALDDPRFNVRFEAIVSIARREPDERLTRALTEVLEGDEPALSVLAAWALGRIGDKTALRPLRAGLDARYRSVQAHCARSLGTLGDREVIPLLLSRLAQETDDGLRVAYASALGSLRVEQSVDELLGFMHTSRERASRMELALALARIVGEEHHFIQLVRSRGAELSITTSQTVTAAHKRMRASQKAGPELLALMEECARTLGREDFASGAEQVSRIIRLLPAGSYDRTSSAILDDCAERLDQFGANRVEYLLLALHTLRIGG